MTNDLLDTRNQLCSCFVNEFHSKTVHLHYKAHCSKYYLDKLILIDCC